MIAKNKSKFIVAVIAVFLAIVTVGVGIIVSTPRASGATFTDGTGHSYTGTGHNVKGDFNIRYLDTDNEIAGYRFTVLKYDSSISKYDIKGSLDVFKTDTRMPSNSNNAYTSHLKYTVGSATRYNYDKYTLKRYYSSLSITPEDYTSSNSYRVYSSSQVVAGKYNYALASDLGVALPDTTGMEDFSNNEDNIDKILSRLGNDDSGSAYTLNTLLPNPEMFVFVEPLFDIRLGNLGDTSNKIHAFSITLSEIALIGRLVLGDDSTGYESGGWSTSGICSG